MNVGDKYICIKNVPEYFIKGKIYTVCNVTRYQFFIMSENGFPMSFYIHTPDENTYICYEHFIPYLKDIRKQKLKKIFSLNNAQ